MKDRRTIMALIIIGIILLMTPTYMRLMYGPSPSSAPADSTGAATDTTGAVALAGRTEAVPGQEEAGVVDERIISESERQLQSLQVAMQQEGRVLIIQTPHYRAALNTRGAVIEHWQLKGYYTKDGSPIELIPTDAHGLVIEVPVGDSRIQSREFVFETEAHDSIVVEADEEVEISLYAELGGGRRISRLMRFSGNSFDVYIQDGFEGFQTTPMNDAYRLMWIGGLRFTEENRVDEIRYTGFQASQGGRVESLTRLKRKEAVEEKLFGFVDWAALRTKYFAAVLMPLDEPFSSVRMMGEAGEIGPARMNMGVDRRVPTGEGGTVGTLLYIGPIDYRIFKSYDVGLQKMMDFGSGVFSFIRPISKLSLLLFIFLYEFIPNYGVVIVIFSILVKILVFPLTKKFYASMHAMQELAPKMKEIREKHKDDPQKMNRKIMNLYKEHKVNPLGGCFPMLLQMPIFVALFTILRTTIELRGAPFVLWITDLSLKDPYLILPGLMSLSMLVQQRAQLSNPQQRMMAIMMPAVLFFMFKGFPAGLTLYWTLFNIFSIVQTELTPKKSKQAST